MSGNVRECPALWSDPSPDREGGVFKGSALEMELRLGISVENRSLTVAARTRTAVRVNTGARRAFLP